MEDQELGPCTIDDKDRHPSMFQQSVVWLATTLSENGSGGMVLGSSRDEGEDEIPVVPLVDV